MRVNWTASKYVNQKPKRGKYRPEPRKQVVRAEDRKGPYRRRRR